MLSEKFKTKKQIYFTYNQALGIDGEYLLSGNSRFCVVVAGYQQGIIVNDILEKSGKLFEIRA